MRRLFLAWLLVCLPAAIFAQATDQGATQPIEVDTVETATVRLIILDMVVVDGDGRTVPGLTLNDFEIVAGGKAVPADTLDVDCQEPLEEPEAIGFKKSREIPAPGNRARKIVLAFDYMHLRQPERAEVLDHAMRAMKNTVVPGDEIMVAALVGGVRIESTFTNDHDAVWNTLRRMQRDITLWQPSFYHMNERSWVTGMTTLFDVLGTVQGPKAVVMFSGMADVPLDIQFQEIAAQASASRCSVYPMDFRGVLTDRMQTGSLAEDLNPGTSMADRGSVSVTGPG